MFSYEIIEAKDGSMVVLRNGMDGRRSVVGGRSYDRGLCYEAAWIDYTRLFSTVRKYPDGTVKRVLMKPSDRPAFVVDFVSFEQNTLKGLRGAA